MTASFSVSAATQNPVMAASAAMNAASSLGGGTTTPPTNYGLTMRFAVTLSNSAYKSLGDWTSCTGLAVTFKHDTYDAGGSYDHTTVLPGRIEYSDVTLERPITKESNMLVMKWLADVRNNWVNGTDPSTYARQTVTITLYGNAVQGTSLTPVARWSLVNALPVSWTGPTMQADVSKVATEKLVLRHEGFLTSGGASS